MDQCADFVLVIARHGHFVIRPCPWVAGLYRVVDSENVRLVNLQGQFHSSACSMVFELHNGTGVSAPRGDWPAIWFRTIK